VLGVTTKRTPLAYAETQRSWTRNDHLAQRHNDRRVAVRDGCLEITGGPLAGGDVDPHNDHRMAMACAVAGLRSRNGARMEGEACVAKSYPEFFQALESIRG